MLPQMPGAGATPNSTIIPMVGGPSPVMQPNHVTASVPISAPGVTPIGTHGFDSLYGNDTGNAVAQVFNQMNPTGAFSMGQQVINANMPNVAQGQANLNAHLAAAGIGPSSSVSAIENADYMGGVARDDMSTLANFGLDEQKMQADFLLNLLPGQQQREADSSGWSIFNDVMTGLGDVAGVAGDIMGIPGMPVPGGKK